MEPKTPDRSDHFGADEILAHRIRHIVAVIRSLVARTAARKGGELQDYAAHLDGRIAAFSRVQTSLLLHPGSALDLENILGEELLAQSASDEQFTLSGPAVVLPERVAEVLTMAFHELATNATKFGALSHEAGKLNINWRIEGGATPRVRLLWEETGVSSPAQSCEGFGLELVTRQAPYEIGGHVVLEFTADGVRCEMIFPVEPQKEDAP